MRNILAIGALFAALIGCQTTAPQIKEPGRTEYYFFCLSNGLHVSTCACMEDKAVRDTGIDSLEGLSEEDPKVATFIGALQGAAKECHEKTLKLLGDEAAE